MGLYSIYLPIHLPYFTIKKQIKQPFHVGKYTVDRPMDATCGPFFQAEGMQIPVTYLPGFTSWGIGSWNLMNIPGFWVTTSQTVGWEWDFWTINSRVWLDEFRLLCIFCFFERESIKIVFLISIWNQFPRVNDQNLGSPWTHIFLLTKPWSTLHQW